MKDAVYWQEQTPLARRPPLSGRVACDALVVGGGITGLTAAGFLRDRGADVVVLEASVCGSGATGRSSGFITPDSELQVAQLVHRFGDAEAGRIWRTGMDACDAIRRTAESLPDRAHLQDSDSLFVSVQPSGEDDIREEHASRQRLGLDSQLCSPSALDQLLGGNGFSAGVRYGRTFSIDPFAYVAGLRDRLTARGVRVFEHSPVVGLGGRRARTAAGEVSASSIFLCLEQSARAIGVAQRDVDAAQSFLLLSEPLPEATLRRLFPAGPLLVWDTDLIYHYFRPTPDGRVLAGGSNLCETYRNAPRRPDIVRRQIREYLCDRLGFPRAVGFSHWWSGRIGVTKDFLPLAGASPDSENQWWALCGAGLPWSVVAAQTAVGCATEGRSDLEKTLDPRRAFSEAEVVQPLVGRRATFALSHYLNKKHETPAQEIPQRQRVWRAGLFALLALPLAALWRRVRRRPGGP